MLQKTTCFMTNGASIAPVSRIHHCKYNTNNANALLHSPSPSMIFGSVLDDIGKELGVHALEDWYKISAKQVKDKDSTILGYYQGSLIRALKDVHPEYSWK